MESPREPEDCLGNGAGVSPESSISAPIETLATTDVEATEPEARVEPEPEASAQAIEPEAQVAEPEPSAQAIEPEPEAKEESEVQAADADATTEAEPEPEQEQEQEPEAEADPFAALPAPLAATLHARGFTELTPVQKAALECLEAGRDLRITSQTGSGKTVALGLVMAATISDEARETRAPLALVIAPTRELASQVREELAWLFAELPDANVECVTGGTSVYHERKRLQRGPRVIVGTPGRLCDHLRTHALDLSKVREVVLDEADQMLDMGFREELETILEATPTERRTHMVSATFSRAVGRLAERYQSEAHSIEGTQLGVANADIEHIGYMMRSEDRYGALVNTLLLGEGQRCLVFVPTRADAARISEDLAKDGFGALALSGDLQQAQRTRTLSAFKNGTVHVLVATDVAARGLDVPDVSMVVHYAPPSEGEAYVHRSGRTGRAGNKGTSLLFAPFNRRRRIERILQDEGVELKWSALPSADSIKAELAKRDTARLAEAIDAEVVEAQLETARTLLEGREAEHVVAALLERAKPKHAREPFEVAPNDGRKNDRGDRGDRQDRGDRRDRGDRPQYDRGARGPVRTKPGYARFFINWGAQYGATPGRLMAVICRRGDISSRDVGSIDMGPRGSTFEIADPVSESFEQNSSRPDTRDPLQKIRRDQAGSGGGYQGGGYQGGGQRQGGGGYQGGGYQGGGQRQGGGGRPWQNRDGGDRGGNRPYQGGGGDRPYRDGGGNRPYQGGGGDRPFQGGGGSRPYRDGGGDRPFQGGGGNRPYRESGSDRRFPDGGGDRPYRSGGGDRSFRDGGGDRPYRSGGGDQPYRQGGGDRPYREGGNKRTFRDSSADRPYKERRN